MQALRRVVVVGLVGRGGGRAAREIGLGIARPGCAAFPLGEIVSLATSVQEAIFIPLSSV